MKALHIAVFIFILNISLASMNEVFGVGSSAVSTPISKEDIGELAPPNPYGTNTWTGLMAGSWLIVSLPVHISKLLKILWYTVMMGDLADTLVVSTTGYHLPYSLVAGLNSLGVILVFLVVLSIIRGRVV